MGNGPQIAGLREKNSTLGMQYPLQTRLSAFLGIGLGGTRGVWRKGMIKGKKGWRLMEAILLI